MFENKRILLICDDEEMSRYLRDQLVFAKSYSLTFAESSHNGIKALNENSFDLLLVEFGMFDLEASELVRNLKKTDPDCVIIAFLQEPAADVIKNVVRLGIYDYFSRPINEEKLLFTIRKGIEFRSLLIANKNLTLSLKEHNISLERQNVLLGKRLEESTKNLTKLYEDLRSTYMHTIKVLAQTIDARDHYTHSHSENVAKYAVAIAEEMKLPADEVEMLREACELHDLGKIGIEDKILSKATTLSEEEWKAIRRHPEMAAKILEPLTFLNTVIEIIKQHHEHYDGKGYPEGRKGEDMLLAARILNVADSYESMSSSRPYRKTPLTKEEIVLELKKNSGTQFDPGVIESFLRIIDRF